MKFSGTCTSLVWLLAATCTNPIHASDEQVETEVETETESNDVSKCGLYLAVSSTSTIEEPKWGLYAGKSIKKGEFLGGDLAVQTFHLMANSLYEDEEQGLEGSLSEVVEFFEQYIWVPQISGGHLELSDGGRIVTAVSGAGVLGGFNPKLTNADWNHSLAYHREAWNEQPGVAHPGRGAYTNYFNVGLSATQDIKAGSEVFVNYGENWEEEEEEDDDEEGNGQITKEDHAKIDQTIEKMIEFFQKHEKDLDEQSKGEIYEFLIKDVMTAAAGKKKGKKISEMLPDNPDHLSDVLKNGGSLALSSPTAIRSIEWLDAHGRCMDNIRPGPSTIPYAGRGAFATRDMAKGSIVAPVPLVQITQEAILEMYPVKTVVDDEDEEYFVRDGDSNDNMSPTGMQLLLNYCLGHPESTMMFFPAGVYTGFINHSKEPNAKLVWSDHPNHHKHWFDMEPNSLIAEGNQHLGLLMEIEAIKDIKEGDEIFIDYGDDWSDAWEAHLQAWKELQESGDIPTEWQIKALDLNNEYKNKPFEIEASHPDNVKRMCFLMVKKPTDEAPVNAEGDKVRIWVEGGAKTSMLGENLFECDLKEREEIDGQWFYTIAWSNGHETTIVKKVPHKAVVFVDNPGTSDQHIPYGFRHYIGIPDEIFPQGPWRNVGGDEDGDDYE